MSVSQRGRTVLTATCVAVLAVTGCQKTTEGAATGVDVSSVSGLELTYFESGLKSDAPEPEVDVEDATSSEEDKLAIATIADMNAYWGETLPEEFDMDYEEVKRLISYDSSKGSGPNTECGKLKEPNAFYCPPGDIVAWDRGQLLPMLTDAYGPVAVITVLAHEYGHAIQSRLAGKAGIEASTPTIVKELQADCFTGSYMRWAADGNSEQVGLSTVSGLNSAMASLYFVRDQPGTTLAVQGAHGTSFDRTQSFQEGFESGPKTCAGYTYKMLKERTTQQTFDEKDTNKGEATVDEQNAEFVEESLDYTFEGKNGPDIKFSGASCRPEGAPASYCEDSNQVAVDAAALSQIARPIDMKGERTGRGNTGGQGDFAAWASVASRYVLGVQKNDGVPIDTDMTGMRTACLVGAWASTANRKRDQASGKSIIRLSSGDVDEAILEMLQAKSVIASNVKGAPVPAGFLRIEAFRTGYNEGPQNCGSKFAEK